MQRSPKILHTSPLIYITIAFFWRDNYLLHICYAPEGPWKCTHLFYWILPFFLHSFLAQFLARFLAWFLARFLAQFVAYTFLGFAKNPIWSALSVFLCLSVCLPLCRSVCQSVPPCNLKTIGDIDLLSFILCSYCWVLVHRL